MKKDKSTGFRRGGRNDNTETIFEFKILETFALNEITVKFLNHWANSSVYASNLVTFCGVYLGWLLLFYLLFYIYRSPHHWRFFRFVLIALSSALVSLFISDILKSLFQSERPSFALDLRQIFAPNDRESFPSGHMAFFGGLAFAMWWHKREIGYWFLLAVILIGLARIAAGVHYPLDILAGLALSFVVSLFFRRFLKSHRTYRKSKNKAIDD